MIKNTGDRIVIIGCGNVAWHIAKKFSFFKKFSLFIYNHAPNPALNDFKSELKCHTEPSLDNIINDAAVYFICVSDNYIAEVSDRIKCKKEYGPLVVHTSGSAELSDIKCDCAHKGVFYPLQTFSKKDVVNWKNIPLIIEANSNLTKKRIVDLAKLFTGKRIFLNYRERLTMHLSAVLVNNFTNALYVAASDLIETNKKGFDLLLPIIRQTTTKIEKMPPRTAQTGPAKRNDKNVLNKHLKLLSKNTELKKVYKQLSKLITTQQQLHA